MGHARALPGGLHLELREAAQHREARQVEPVLDGVEIGDPPGARRRAQHEDIRPRAAGQHAAGLRRHQDVVAGPARQPTGRGPRQHQVVAAGAGQVRRGAAAGADHLAQVVQRQAELRQPRRRARGHEDLDRAAQVHRLDRGDVLQPQPGVMDQALQVHQVPVGQQREQRQPVIRPAGEHEDMALGLDHGQRLHPAEAGVAAVEQVVGRRQAAIRPQSHHAERTAAGGGQDHPSRAEGGHGLQRGRRGDAQPLGRAQAVGGGERTGAGRDAKAAHPLPARVGDQQDGGATGLGHGQLHPPRKRVGRSRARGAPRRQIALRVGGIGRKPTLRDRVDRRLAIRQRQPRQRLRGTAPRPRQIERVPGPEPAIGRERVARHRAARHPGQQQERRTADPGQGQRPHAQPRRRRIQHLVGQRGGAPVAMQPPGAEPAQHPGRGIEICPAGPAHDLQIAQIPVQKVAPGLDPGLERHAHVAPSQASPGQDHGRPPGRPGGCKSGKTGEVAAGLPRIVQVPAASRRPRRVPRVNAALTGRARP